MAEKRVEYRPWKFSQGVEFSGSSGFTQTDRGTVTQITTSTTTVVLAKLAGTITTLAGTLGAGAEESFTVTDTSVAATDFVGVCIKSYGGAGTPLPFVSAVGTGSFVITITNLHATNALDAAIVLNFTVIKAA